MFGLMDSPHLLRYNPNFADPSLGTINIQNRTITLSLDVYHELLNRHRKNERLDQFFMYIFKVKQCSKKHPHDWTQCPFAHRGEKARRRDPMKFPYQGATCPEFKFHGQCKKGPICQFSHGIFEFWLHPSRFRTRLCELGLLCTRKACFFAHSLEQLRPTEYLMRNAAASSSSSNGRPKDNPNDMFADYAHMDLVVDLFSSFHV